MGPWMPHMLPARGRPYNSESAYIFAIAHLPSAAATKFLTKNILLTNALYHKFVFKSFVLGNYLQFVHNYRLYTKRGNV